MKYFLGLIIITYLLSSCGQRTIESKNQTPDTVKNSTTEVITKTVDIFADSNFTFVSIDSLNEDMLFDESEKGKTQFIKSRKSFKQEHCEFFKTGCTNSFWDDYTFLVAKQDMIGDILPIIIHTSKDFNYYHSELHTLDKNHNKVDILIVSLDGFDQEPEDDYSTITKAKSRFKSDLIITTNVKFRRYRKANRDSLVTVDSTIVYRRIEKTGKIIIDKTEKII